MGDNVENFYPGAHVQPVPGGIALKGIKPRVHKASASIDSTAPHEAVGAGLAAIHTAATLTAFNAAMAAEYPTWWPTYSAQFGSVAFQTVTALPG